MLILSPRLSAMPWLLARIRTCPTTGALAVQRQLYAEVGERVLPEYGARVEVRRHEPALPRQRLLRSEALHVG